MTTKGDIEQAWRRIEGWLESNAPAAFEDLQPPAADGHVQAAEKKLGVELPSDAVASYGVHDGQRGAAEPLVNGWAPLPISKVVEHWTRLKALLDKGDFGENSGSALGPVKSVWWDPSCVPLLHNESGDYQCADVEPPDGGTFGQIVEFRHAAPERKVVADSLGGLLEAFADDLEAGTYDVEEGQLVPKDG